MLPCSARVDREVACDPSLERWQEQLKTLYACRMPVDGVGGLRQAYTCSS